MKRVVFILLAAFPGSSFSQMILPIFSSFTDSRSIPCTPVKDQNLSSTCWSFASNSFIESEILKTKGIATDLSEMFIARYSYLNKVRQYLLQEGKTYFTPGGQFHDVLKVIRQYGMMPEQAYSGKAHGELNHDHAALDTIMKHYVDGLLAKHTKILSINQLNYINNTLDKYLGKVPATFIFEGKKYTPKTFSTDALHFNPDEYIEITSYTHHPFYEKFILEDRYNWTMDYYYNVPIDDLIEITRSAFDKNYSVCWDGDVTEEGFLFNDGTAMLIKPVVNYQLTRQQTFEDKSTTIDHMMHITGIASDKNNSTWYRIKNSWGSNNILGGYMLMSEDYFKIKTVAIIVNKKSIPPGILKKMKLT